MRIWLLCGLILALTTAVQAGPKKKKPAAPEVPASVKADPNWKMLDHVEAVFALLEKHQGKCEKAVVATTAYVEEHKQELKDLRKLAHAKSLCPKAKKRADSRIQARAERLGEKFSPLMFGFYKQCPDHVDRLHRGTMQFLGSKCKQDGSAEDHAGH